jgi:hypothetical protein
VLAVANCLCHQESALLCSFVGSSCLRFVTISEDSDGRVRPLNWAKKKSAQGVSKVKKLNCHYHMGVLRGGGQIKGGFKLSVL